MCPFRITIAGQHVAILTGFTNTQNVGTIKPKNDVFTFGVWKIQEVDLQMTGACGDCGRIYRGPFGIEKLDHPSDRWSVAARAARRLGRKITSTFISGKDTRKVVRPAQDAY